MNCAEFEILLCDHLDGTLQGEQKSAFEAHLRECAACGELARDSAGAIAFLSRVADVEPPPELMTRILYEMPAVKRPAVITGFWSKVKSTFIDPVLQPRFAMSMAMTVLSFAMLGRFTGIEIRQLKPADLNPVAVWTALEDKALRTWERTVKYYDSLKLVYEIQGRLQEWGDQAEADRNAAAAKKAAVPIKTGVSKEQGK
jgi:hypothetical protein